MLYSRKALSFLALYEIATRPKRDFRDLLTPEGRRRRDRRIPRASKSIGLFRFGIQEIACLIPAMTNPC